MTRAFSGITYLVIYEGLPPRNGLTRRILFARYSSVMNELLTNVWRADTLNAC